MIQSILQRRFSHLSYSCGTGSRPLLYRTLGEQFLRTTEIFPDRYAVCSEHEDMRFTYTEFYMRARKLASGLLSLKFKNERMSRVGVFAPNILDYYTAQLACSLADLVLVNINPLYRAHELKYALNKVQCEALLMVSQVKTSNYDEMLQEIAPEIQTSKPGEIHSPELPHLKYVVKMDNKGGPGYLTIDEIFEAGELSLNIMKLDLKESLIRPEDVTNIQFTSGTTGSPKAATLSHFSILNNGWLLSERLRYTENDKIICSVPLYHCFGMVISNMAALTNGCEVIFPSETFDAAASMKALSDRKATSVYGVPTMFLEYLKHLKANPSKYDLSNARTGVIAGSICPRPLMEDIYTYMNLTDLTVCYGMTETSPVTFQTHHDDSFEKKTGTVGNILPHTESKIVDENGHILKRGQRGEVLARGYCVMKGYWDDQEATKNAIDQDGWMHTGDLGVMDEEGYLNIVGRIKDLIIRGGENISPKEIEEYYLRHHKVENAQVFAFPDEKYGEEVFIWIKNKAGEKMTNKEVLDYAKGKIAHYKIPKYVKFVDDFPITVTGKPQKFRMTEAMVSEINENPKALEEYKIR